MTNRQWLENMSDKNLARWILDTDINLPCEYCEIKDGIECIMMKAECLGTQQAWEKWLKAEHDS